MSQTKTYIPSFLSTLNEEMMARTHPPEVHRAATAIFNALEFVFQDDITSMSDFELIKQCSDSDDWTHVLHCIALESNKLMTEKITRTETAIDASFQSLESITNPSDLIRAVITIWNEKGDSFPLRTIDPLFVSLLGPQYAQQWEIMSNIVNAIHFSTNQGDITEMVSDERMKACFAMENFVSRMACISNRHRKFIPIDKGTPDKGVPSVDGGVFDRVQDADTDGHVNEKVIDPFDFDMEESENEDYHIDDQVYDAVVSDIGQSRSSTEIGHTLPANTERKSKYPSRKRTRRQESMSDGRNWDFGERETGEEEEEEFRLVPNVSDRHLAGAQRTFSEEDITIPEEQIAQKVGSARICIERVVAGWPELKAKYERGELGSQRATFYAFRKIIVSLREHYNNDIEEMLKDPIVIRPFGRRSSPTQSKGIDGLRKALSDKFGRENRHHNYEI